MRGTIVRKGDITVAKNYLNSDEIDSLNRLTVLFLDSAEIRVKERKDLSLDFWITNVNRLLEFQGKDQLIDKGRISNTQMEKIVTARYEEFNQKRKKDDAKKADNEDLNELYRLLQ